MGVSLFVILRKPHASFCRWTFDEHPKFRVFQRALLFLCVQTAMVVSVAVWMTVEGTAAAVCAARAALAAVRAAGAVLTC
jgi:hypothetical protein